MDKMNLKDVFKAIGILAKTDPKIVEGILSDEALQKAGASMDGLKAENNLGGVVDDHWTMGEGHKAATAEQIKVGPPFSASGTGAEKMVAHYSHPAAQAQIEMVAMQLQEHLGPIRGAIKAQGEAISALLKNTSSLNAVFNLLTTKAKEDDEDEEDEEESEVVEINASKAKRLIRKAQRLINKSEAQDDDAKAKALLTEAGKLLGKARISAMIAGDKDLRKSIRDIAAKADVEVVQEEEEDEEEEKAKKAKADAEAAAAKAVADAAAKAEAANQSDKQNKDGKPVAGNQDDSAKAVTALKAQVETMQKAMEDALNGLKPLSMNVSQLMDTLSGKSKVLDAAGGGESKGPPDFVKAHPMASITSLEDRIEELQDGGTLDGPQAMTARDICAMIKGVHKGEIDANMVNSRIAKSSAAVRMLFNAAA